MYNPVCLWVTNGYQSTPVNPVSLGDKCVPVNPVCLWVTNGTSQPSVSLGDQWVPVNPVCLWVTNGYQSTQCVFG